MLTFDGHNCHVVATIWKEQRGAIGKILSALKICPSSRMKKALVQFTIMLGINVKTICRLRMRYKTHQPNCKRRTPLYGFETANILLAFQKPYMCASCFYRPTWSARVSMLQVDHIDSNPYNSSIHNLQFLCPNCHVLKTKKIRGHNCQHRPISSDEVCESRMSQNHTYSCIHHFIRDLQKAKSIKNILMTQEMKKQTLINILYQLLQTTTLTCPCTEFTTTVLQNLAQSKRTTRDKLIKIMKTAKKDTSFCQMCNYNHPNVLQVDHIDGNPSNNNPHNLRVLCANCHYQRTRHSVRKRSSNKIPLSVLRCLDLCAVKYISDTKFP